MPFLTTKNLRQSLKHVAKLYKLLTITKLLFTFFYVHKKRVLNSRKIFDIRFSIVLHVYRCPKQDLTIFRKCLSVCMFQKFCGHCISRTNARKWMKLYNQLHLDMILCWLDFGVYCSIICTATEHFPRISGFLYLWF